MTEQSCFEEDRVWVKPTPICANETCSTTIPQGMKMIVDDQRGIVFCSERCQRLFEQRPGRV